MIATNSQLMICLDYQSVRCDKKIIRLKIERNYFGYQARNTDFFPDEFLEDLQKMKKYVNDPLSWISGQFIHHVIKLNNQTRQYLNEKLKKKNLQKPYLGYFVIFSINFYNS